MAKLIDKIGHRNGRLIVVSEIERTNRGERQFICLCDCGKQKILKYKHLSATESCGCVRQERLFRTHGLSNSSEYNIWGHIISRCYNPKVPEYKNYGGRGITMCDRWRASFEDFISDMGPRPVRASIDRIDNNKGYEPSNCRWSNPKEQAKNRRTTRLIEYQGLKMCLKDWAKYLGIDRHTLAYRLNRGWSIEKILTQKASRENIPKVSR